MQGSEQAAWIVVLIAAAICAFAGLFTLLFAAGLPIILLLIVLSLRSPAKKNTVIVVSDCGKKLVFNNVTCNNVSMLKVGCKVLKCKIKVIKNA